MIRFAKDLTLVLALAAIATLLTSAVLLGTY
jgi:hypothetical protein